MKPILAHLAALLLALPERSQVCRGLLLGRCMFTSALVAGGLAARAVAQEVTSQTWLTYERQLKEGKDLILPNFAYAGYQAGAEPPTVDYPVFDVTKHGAIPNDDRSDREAIERAVAAAKENGSGVIFFPPGRFILNDKAGAEANDNIVIDSPRIVLRGSGTGPTGTVLFMPNHQHMERPPQMYSVPYMINFSSSKREEKKVAVAGNVRMGDMTLTVSDVGPFKTGDCVEVALFATDPSTIAAEIAPHPVEDNMDIKKGVEFTTLFKIVAISAETKTLSINVPFPKTIDIARWKTKHLRVLELLDHCGVEQLTFEGNWTGKFVHHNPVDGYIDDSGWSGIRFRQVVDGWIRDVRFKNVNRAVNLTSSLQCTVMEVAIEGNNGHQASELIYANHNLFVRCADRVGMHHTWGASSHSVGNVFYKTTARAHKSFDCHGPLVRNTLFDQVEMALTETWGGPPSNHPNHAQNLVLWNTRAVKSLSRDDYDYSQFQFWRFPAKYGRIVPPIVVGLHGMPVHFARDQVLIEESNGTPVTPASLYEAQLKTRMRTLPAYLNR